MHFINHTNGRIYNRICTNSSGTFAKAQTKVEERFCVEAVEHTAVSGFVATMTENTIVEHIRI